MNDEQVEVVVLAIKELSKSINRLADSISEPEYDGAHLGFYIGRGLHEIAEAIGGK